MPKSALRMDQANVKKPVVGFIAGQTAPRAPHGHAGAIIAAARHRQNIMYDQAEVQRYKIRKARRMKARAYRTSFNVLASGGAEVRGVYLCGMRRQPSAPYLSLAVALAALNNRSGMTMRPPGGRFGRR